MAVVVCSRRGQPECVLAELGSGDGRAACVCQVRGFLEGRGDFRVSALCGESEVAGAVERVLDNRGDASVRAAPLFRRGALVEH
jgi:hypothetical protein